MSYTGTTAYPYGVGPLSHYLNSGLGRALSDPDDQLKLVQGALRLQSCTGSMIDSFAYDFFQGAFYRFSQYGETDQQFIARILAIFATPKATPSGTQQIVNVFWPWIKLQLKIQNLGEDTGIGGEDVSGGEDIAVNGTNASPTVSGLALGEDKYGGEDTGQQYEDAPGPGTLPPVPIIFDEQSSIQYSSKVGMTPPYFGVYIQYPGYSDSLMRAVNSPSLILTQLINIWKAVGTQPVYLSNH